MMEFTGERMIPEYNKTSFLYEEHIARYSYAAAYCKGKKVLDIACGAGYGSEILSRVAAAVVGVDISNEAIEYCKENFENPKTHYVTGEVTDIPLDDADCDIVVSFETIEHVCREEQERFLKEVKRVLAEKGLFICSTPNTDNSPKGNEYHKEELNPKEFENFLKKYFRHVKIYYQDLIAVSYFLEKGANRQLTGSRDNIDIDSSKFLMAICSDVEIESEEAILSGSLKPKEVEYSLRRKKTVPEEN